MPATEPTVPRGSRLARGMVDEEGGLRVTFAGVIDEHAQLAGFAMELSQRIADRSVQERCGGMPRVRFDLAAVERLTSAGVREWILFMRGLPQPGQYLWDPGAPVMIRQANAIVGFMGGAKVRSLLFPLFCPACDHELDVLVSLGSGITATLLQLPRTSCPRCSTLMEAAEEPTSFLAFLGG